MNQADIIKYLSDTPRYLTNLAKAYENQRRIDDFEKKNQTIEQRIYECAQRCQKDLNELKELLLQYNRDALC